MAGYRQIGRLVIRALAYVPTVAAPRWSIDADDTPPVIFASFDGPSQGELL